LAISNGFGLRRRRSFTSTAVECGRLHNPKPFEIVPKNDKRRSLIDEALSLQLLREFNNK